MQNFNEKVAKIHQKRLNLENARLIFKEGFNREPIGGLTQSINIFKNDWETFDILRKYFCISHFCEIFVPRENNFHEISPRFRFIYIYIFRIFSRNVSSLETLARRKGFRKYFFILN